jgi:uncharacterized tellurite resistance protein B-like protein
MAEFTTEQLILALGHHIGQKVIGFDGEVDPRELAQLHELYPRAAMAEAGFIDDGGKFTALFEEAAREALKVLPGQLDRAGQKALLSDWLQLALADERYKRSEDVVLHRAGAALGWTSAEVDGLLVEIQKG